MERNKALNGLFTPNERLHTHAEELDRTFDQPFKLALGEVFAVAARLFSGFASAHHFVESWPVKCLKNP